MSCPASFLGSVPPINHGCPSALRNPFAAAYHTRFVFAFRIPIFVLPMTGKAYYITTLADWQRHAARFANSHFIVLDPPANDGVIPNPAPTHPVGDEGRAPGSTVSRAREIGEGPAVSPVPSNGETPQQIPRTEPLRRPRNDNTAEVMAVVEAQGFSPANNDAPQAPSDAQRHPQHVFGVCSNARQKMDRDADCRILVLIEADEGVHLSLEDDSAFEPLPHPLAQRPISDAAQAALAPHGVAPGATTFDAAETLARIHPLLKHRVF